MNDEIQGYSSSAKSDPYNASSTKRLHQLRLYNMKEILNLNIETNWLIEDYFEKETTGVLYGPSGTFKTFLALDWCLSIASGQNWHNHEVSQGLVVYVAGEGNHGLQKRIKAWIKNKKINYGSEIPFIASNQRVAILNNSELSIFKHQLNQITQPIKLIVFDTLRKCFGNGDENHSKDMGEFLDQIETIRQNYNTTCLIVHHTNKSKVIRGSNALESDVDFVYRLESKNKLHCTLHAEKIKDSDSPSPMQFELKSILIGDNNNKTINSLVLSSIDYQSEQETNKPNGIRGVVHDYIQNNCNKAMTWSDLTRNMIDDSSLGDYKLTKINIRTALNGLLDSNIESLDFGKLDGQNAVRTNGIDS